MTNGGRTVAWTIAGLAVAVVVVFGVATTPAGELWTAAVAGAAFLAGRASRRRLHWPHGQDLTRRLAAHHPAAQRCRVTSPVSGAHARKRPVRARRHRARQRPHGGHRADAACPRAAPGAAPPRRPRPLTVTLRARQVTPNDCANQGPDQVKCS